MFSNLRQGSQVYILHKSVATPYVEVGSVDMLNNGFGSYFPNVPINVTIRVGEKSYPYQNLPFNAEVADVTNNTTGETITIACNKDVLNAEIRNLRQKSTDAINSVEYHKSRLSSIDSLYQSLNPEETEKINQAKEISELRNQVSQMADMITKLSSELKTKETSSSKTKGRDEHNND